MSCAGVPPQAAEAAFFIFLAFMAFVAIGAEAGVAMGAAIGLAMGAEAPFSVWLAATAPRLNAETTAATMRVFIVIFSRERT